jgi:hypothetical protein
LGSTDSTRLDVDGAIQAAALGNLASGLVLASMLLLLVSLFALAVRSSARFKGTAASNTPMVVPWASVTQGAAVIAILGGILGVVATVANGSIVSESGAEALITPFGLWPLLTILLGVMAVWFARSAHQRRTVGSISAVAVVATLVLVGTASAERLPRPDRFAQATASLTDTVQGSVSLFPAAAGSNDILIGLTGPTDDVDVLKALVREGEATVTLTSLAGANSATPARLMLNQDGAVVAEDLFAASPGRWRIFFDFGDGSTSAVVDMTLQSNPRVTQ